MPIRYRPHTHWLWIVLLLAAAHARAQAPCNGNPDWADNTSLNTLSCRLEDRLGRSARKDRDTFVFGNMWNYVLGAKVGFEVSTSTAANIWTPHVTAQVKALIMQSRAEVEALPSGSYTDFVKALKIREVLEKYSRDPRMKPEQVTLLALATNDLLNRVLIREAEDRYRVDLQHYFAIQDVNFQVDALRHELDASIPAKEALIEKIRAEVERALSQGRTRWIAQSPEFQKLQEQVETLSKEQGPAAQTKREAAKRRMREILLDEAQGAAGRRQTQYQEASHGVTIYSTLLSLQDPKLGQSVGIVAQSALRIGSAIDQIASSATGSYALGPYASIATASLAIYGQLAASGPTPDEVLLGQLRKLSLQLAELRKEMHDRFDRVEEILGRNYVALVKRFEHLDQNLDALAAGQNDIRYFVETIELQLSVHDRRLRTYQLAETKQMFEQFFNNCYHHEAYTTLPLLESQYYMCMRGFANLAVVQARAPWFTGAGSALTPAEISGAVTGRDYQSAGGLLADYSSYPNQFPNSRVWREGAEAYMAMRERYPQYPKAVLPALTERVRSGGMDILAFGRYLRADATLLGRMSSEYAARYRELMVLFGEYARDARRRTFEALEDTRAEAVLTALDRTLTKAPTVSVGACTMSHCQEMAKRNLDRLKAYREQITRTMTERRKSPTPWQTPLIRGWKPSLRDLAAGFMVRPCDTYELGTTPFYLPAEAAANLLPNNVLAAIRYGIAELDFCYSLRSIGPGRMFLLNGSKTHHGGALTYFALHTWSVVGQDRREISRRSWTMSACPESGASVFGKGSQIGALMNGTLAHRTDFDCVNLDLLLKRPEELEVELHAYANGLVEKLEARQLEGRIFVHKAIAEGMWRDAKAIQLVRELDALAELFRLFASFAVNYAFLNDGSLAELLFVQLRDKDGLQRFVDEAFPSSAAGVAALLASSDADTLSALEREGVRMGTVLEQLTAHLKKAMADPAHSSFPSVEATLRAINDFKMRYH